MRGAMASKPRRGTLAEAAQVAADLHAGGVRALRAAEELLRTSPRMRSWVKAWKSGEVAR